MDPMYGNFYASTYFITSTGTDGKVVKKRKNEENE